MMSLFNRPTWAKSQTSELDESETNLFSHSDRSYQDIVAEQERKKREKLERQKAKEERRGSGKHKIKDEFAEDGTVKRRRITAEDGEALLSSVGLWSTLDSGVNGQDDGFGTDLVDGPVRRSPRLNRHVNRVSPRKPKKRDRTAEAIDLGDSDDANDVTITKITSHEAEAIEEESDEEFAELARRARQERPRSELREKNSRTPDVAVNAPSPGSDALDTGQRSLPTPPPDPIVQIFKASRIPNTNPLIVHRRLSQRIQEIRTAWCEKQGFPRESYDDIFFVHRMRRVYDVTTCKSLGLDVDAFGNLTMKGAEGKDGVEKVHLEAVTEDIFQQMKDEKAQEAKKRSGELRADEFTEAGAADNELVMQQPKEESLIRIVLKAKDRADFKLKVKSVSCPMVVYQHCGRCLISV